MAWTPRWGGSRGAAPPRATGAEDGPQDGVKGVDGAGALRQSGEDRAVRAR